MEITSHTLSPKLGFAAFWQLTMAILFMMAVLLVMGTQPHQHVLDGLGMGSLGSSAFLIFTYPKTKTARIKNILGGYFFAIVVGLCGHYLRFHLPFDWSLIPYTFDDACYSTIAFSLAAVLMVIFRCEHPPAVGLAIGLVLDSWNSNALWVVIFGAFLLTCLKGLLRKQLINLL